MEPLLDTFRSFDLQRLMQASGGRGCNLMQYHDRAQIAASSYDVRIVAATYSTAARFRRPQTFQCGLNWSQKGSVPYVQLAKRISNAGDNRMGIFKATTALNENRGIDFLNANVGPKNHVYLKRLLVCARNIE